LGLPGFDKESTGLLRTADTCPKLTRGKFKVIQQILNFSLIAEKPKVAEWCNITDFCINEYMGLMFILTNFDPSYMDN
jgi:hypothetical protein